MSFAQSLGLDIVPIDQVVPHERHNPRRVHSLMQRIAAQGVLTNPPITARSQDTYVILDGATRLAALRQLGYRDVLIQVVDLDAPGVQLHIWRHLLRGMPSSDLVHTLAHMPDLTLTRAPAAWQPSDPLPAATLGCLVTPSGDRWAVMPIVEEEWLHLLNRLVDAYSAWGEVERTLTTDPALLHEQYPGWTGLVILPRFNVEEIMGFARLRRPIPAGISRFIIPGRVLRVNAPLAWLAAEVPLAEKRAWLTRHLAEKLAGRHVRYYEEPVYLLDE